MSKGTLLSFDVEDFEAAALNKDKNSALEMLKELVSFWDQNGVVEGWIEDVGAQQKIYYQGLHPILRDMTFIEKQLYCQRVATAITAIFSDVDFDLPVTDMTSFIFCKEMFRCIFGISSYKSMDHILLFRGLMNKNKTLKLNEEHDVYWLWLCFTFESDINIDLQLMFEEFPEISLYGFLGSLYTNRSNLSKKSSERLKDFIQKIDYLPEVTSPSIMDLMSSAWMLCSYYDDPDRHKVKIALNNRIKNWLDKNIPVGYKKNFKRNTDLKRSIKKVAVFSEKYRSKHAMYRCYHNILVGLKGDYELVLVSRSNEYDEESAKDFDRIIDVDYSTADDSLFPLLKTLAKESFDVIYYPSIGMSNWTIILSNLRMAPYQLMSLGHPDSSFSSEIDYLLPIGMNLSNEQLRPMISEKLLDFELKVDSSIFHPHPELQLFKEQYLPSLKRPEDSVVRIAISSSIMKISRRFLEVCQLIERNSSVPIEFHIFPVLVGSFQKYFFEKTVSSLLTNCKVHISKEYSEYMKVLHQCDLAFGTFPFGSTNTNVDLAVLGIPKLIMNDRSNLAGYTDDQVGKIIGEKGFVRSDNEAGFMANAIYLIHNVEARKALSNEVSTLNIEASLSQGDQESMSPYLGDVFKYLENLHADEFCS